MGLSLVARGRHVRRRRVIEMSRIGVALVLVVAVTAAVSGVFNAGGVSTASAAVQPFNGACGGGATQCVQASLPCAGSACPTVVAGPTQALSTGQFVYLLLSNFPAGDTIRVAFCTTDASNTVVPDPYCATTTSGGLKLIKQFVVIGTDGTATAAMPVAYDPPGQDNPALSALPLVQNGNPAGSFYCDNGPDYCAIVVTDDGPPGSGPTDAPSNSLLIPVSFTLGAAACPSTDPVLFTDSAFSVEQLIPAAVTATCGQPNGVVALNTATNTASEIGDLASGGAPIAFTDDPWDPQLNNDLAPTKTAYAYIPVALSATVVAFLANASSQTQAGVVYPIGKYKMTPNMVAGMVTTSYAGGGGADSLVTSPSNKQLPPLICSQIVGCNKKTLASFNTFYLLNPEPPGVAEPGGVGSFFSNSSSGATYELSQWMCSAPNAPFTVSLEMVGQTQPQSVSVTDTYNTSASTFTTPPTQSPFWTPGTPPSDWPFKTCAPTSQFPTLSPGALQQYEPADTPALQAKAIRAYGAGANLAVGAMDWSEATFGGLNVASLQNASGNFVAPSPSSVQAAMTDAVENADGVFTLDYGDASNAGAYPMPMVSYAVVPTDPLPAAQAKTLTDFLTNLVAFSSGKDGPLPGGYVPLTSSLVTQAQQDIARDIVAQPSTPSSTSSSTSPATSSGSGPASSNGGGGGGLLGGTDLGEGNLGTSAPMGATPVTTASVPSRSTPESAVGALPPESAFDVVLAGSRFVIPVLSALALAAVVAGPVLWAWPRRRRTRPTGHEPATSEGGSI